MMMDNTSRAKKTKYCLRSFPKTFNYKEDEEEVLVDNEDDEYIESEFSENETVITISHPRRKLKNKTKNQSIRTPSPDFSNNSKLLPIPQDINGFNDLINLSRHIKLTSTMYKDCQLIPQIHDVIEEINNLIGLKEVKDALCNMILYEMKETEWKKNDPYWKHMIITGPPGTAKTTLARLIGKLLNRLGKTKSDEIMEGHARNMISKFEGNTPYEVENIVKCAIEKSGVLFIDEAPSLNDNRNEKSYVDSYGGKCIDTLMQLMDKYKNQLIVILAGYKDKMEQNILNSNIGFKRRIQWYFNIESYTYKELYEIFILQINDYSLVLPNDSIIDESWFEKNYNYFPSFGGSIRNFIEKILIIQTKATFGKGNSIFLTNEVLLKAFHYYRKFTLP
jgi:hypothetical protein